MGRTGFEPVTFRTSTFLRFPIRSFDDKDWRRFDSWLKQRYSFHYAADVRCYARKFGHLLFSGNIAELNRLPMSERRRGDVLRALAVLSKYLGYYDEFTRLRKACGLSWERRDGFQSFLRIVRRNAKGDMVEWVKNCVGCLDRSYATFVKFVYLSGLRLGEAIESFNLVVRLSREGRLNEYYDGEMQCLEHYRFPEKFIRVKKNTFISFVPENIISKVCKCRTVSESGLKRRLAKNKLKRRLRDLRDHFATFMVFHGLLREEVDLLQGRVGRSIFMRHYFSPSLKELRDKTLNAVNALLSKLLP